ncbi:MAG: hypothetical protein EHM14_07435 [Methanothrix sp.]|nr:MAG: hypothetical protein EHM14_07435 [Methanothrix sp.]
MVVAIGVSSMNARWIMLAFLLAIFCCQAQSAYITVGTDGANYESIQEAVNASSEGDTIVVQSGVYSENVLVDRSLTLRGQGNPVIDARGNGSPLKLTSSGIVVEGFTLTNSGKSDPGIGIYGSVFRFPAMNNSTIQNNVVANNSIGILVSETESNLVQKNVIRYNRRIGIDLERAEINSISENTIEENGIGISLAASNLNHIQNNTIKGNEKGILLSNRYLSEAGPSGFSDGNSIYGNEIQNNEYGIRLNYAEGNDIHSNKLINNRYAVYLDDSENNSVLENTFVGNNENISPNGVSRSSALKDSSIISSAMMGLLDLFVLLILFVFYSILMTVGLVTGYIVRKVLTSGSLSAAQSSVLGAVVFLAGYLLFTYLVPSSGNEAYVVSVVLAAAVVAAANLRLRNKNSI